MAKKIKHEDLIEKDVLQPTIKQANDLVTALDAVEKKMLELVKTTQEAATENKKFNDSKDAAKQKKAAKELSIAEEGLLKTRKEKRNLEVKLKQLNSDRIQANEVLKVQVTEQRKINKQLAREELGLTGEYEKQSKTLNDLRKKYKNLRLEQGKATKESAELLKEIKELDEALKEVDAETGQFQRNVGNYPQVANQAKASFGSLSGFLLGAFAASFNKSRDTARELQGGIERVTNVVRVLAIGLLEFTKNKAIPTIQNQFLSLQVAFLEFKQVFTFGDASDAIQKDLDAMNKTIAENTKLINSSATGFEKFAKALTGTDENIKERLERQAAMVNTTAQLIDQIQKLSAEEAVLQAQIGNSTFSFAQRDKQIDDLIATQESRLSLEQRIAQAELENALTSIENDLIRRGIGDEFNRQQVVSLKFLDDKNQADAVGIENLQKLTTATARLNELEAERSVQDIEARKERLENARDLFEQELDFTLDISDRQKSVTERQLTDEKLSFEERAKLIKNITSVLDDSFEEQIELTEGFIQKSLEINEGLSGEEALQKVKELNLEKIIGLEDEKQIREELFGAGISDEITQNRIREIIIERKAAIQDVEDSQRDLNEAVEEELNKRITAINTLEQLQIDGQIARTERELEAETETTRKSIALIEEKFDLQKRALEDQADFVLSNDELLAEEREVIAQQLQNDLEALERDRVDAVKAANKELLDDSINTANEIAAAFESAIDDEFAKRKAAIDSEIEQREKAVDFNRQLAIQGNTEAAEQLQFEQEQLAKAAIKKQQLEKQEAQAKRAIAIVDSYFAAFERRLSDPKTETGGAALAALGDVSKGVATSEIAKALVGASFAYTGTENVSSDGAIYDRGSQKDNLLYWLHPNERVMTDKQNAKVGNMSNDKLANLAYDYQNGNLQPYEFQSATYLSGIGGMTDSTLTRYEIANLKAAVNQNASIIASAINNKPVADSHIDANLNLIETVKKNGRTKRTIHKRF